MITNTNLIAIAKYYQSPVWIYDANIIKRQIKKLQKFDIIRFAQKACSNINILQLMKKAGVKIDAVSLGEIERALVSGFDIKNNGIIFTSDLFEEKTLQRIVKLKIPVNFGSIDMIKQIGKILQGKQNYYVWIRINPGFGHGHNKKTNTGGENSKHGIWYADLPIALKLLKKYSLKLVGLHMHIGSGVNYSHLKKVCHSMLEQAININIKIKYISAGGGLSIPYKLKDKKINIENYYKMWNNVRKKLEKYFLNKIKLEIEPGRFLIAESGILLSQIRVIKSVGKNFFVLVNVGFNDLMRPVLYGSYHKISVITFEGKLFDEKEYNKEFIIAGPLCESGDVFTQSKNSSLEPRILPNKIKVGDYLIFHNTGAYGSSMSSNYNTRPFLPEVIYQDKKFIQIRSPQKIEDILFLERNKLIINV